jgi:hypothetical protein
MELYALWQANHQVSMLIEPWPKGLLVKPNATTFEIIAMLFAFDR